MLGMKADVVLTAERGVKAEACVLEHAEIRDRRKRRAGESQVRKAVITVLQVLVALVTARVSRRVSWRDASLGLKLLLRASR